MRLTAQVMIIASMWALPFAGQGTSQQALAAHPPEGRTTASEGPHPVLPFLHDDFTGARTRALKAGKLLVVEAWATWCHTCQSMRSFVFTDPLLKSQAERFIYVALDTDRPANSRFVEKYPIIAWPTMLVLEPAAGGEKDDRVVARWSGAMTAQELVARLGRLQFKASGDADKLMAQADAASSERKWDVAAALYADVVQQSIAERPRALLGEIQALRERGDYDGCVNLVASSLPATGNGAAATDFATYAAACLDHLTDTDRRQRLRNTLRGHLVTLVEDISAPLSVDDRSDAYGTIIELSDALGEKPAGDRYAEARLRMLEAAAAAHTPQEASTFDAQRLESYRRLQRYEPAEKMLVQTMRSQPNDFNAPARLARLYADMGRLDDASLQIAEALTKSYGPRKANLYELQALVRQGLGQIREAVDSLKVAIEVVESQPSPNMHRLNMLRKEIAALQSTLASANQGPRASAEPDHSDARPVASATQRRMTQGRESPKR